MYLTISSETISYQKHLELVGDRAEKLNLLKLKLSFLVVWEAVITFTWLG